MQFRKKKTDLRVHKESCFEKKNINFIMPNFSKEYFC